MNANLQKYNVEYFSCLISQIRSSTFRNDFYGFLCEDGTYCSIMIKSGSDNVISNTVVDLLVVDIFVKLKTMQLQNNIFLSK